MKNIEIWAIAAWKKRKMNKITEDFFLEILLIYVCIVKAMRMFIWINEHISDIYEVHEFMINI